MVLRQQSAVEFISTYSFAIFIIALILVSVSAVALTFSSTPPIYSSCSIQPLIPCQQTLLTYNSPGGYFTFILEFRNNLGFVLQFPDNAINLSTATLATGVKPVSGGTCTPTLAAQGAQTLCRVRIYTSLPSIRQGANIYTQFHIYYGLCLNQTVTTCTANTYSMTGYSYQTLSPPTSNLYNITVSSQNGLVVVNGLPYFNSSVVYLTSGSYTLYAQPSVNYHFVSWSWGGSGTPLSSTTSVNTIFTANALYSNANVIALFLHN